MRRPVAGAACAALVALTACHPPAPAAVANAGHPAAPSPYGPAAWDGLFAGDRTVLYDVTVSSSSYDDQGAPADTSTTTAVTCQVTARVVGRYRAAAIACDHDAFDGLAGRAVEVLEGGFVTDGAALWRYDVDPASATVAELATVTAEPPDLVRDQGSVTAGDDPETDASGSAREVAHEVDAWCVAEHSWGGDGEGTRWCVAAPGIVRTVWWFDGAEAHDAEAVLRP